MTAPSALRIGTRGSDLALWQARRVSAMIDEHLGLASEIVIVKTSGDQIQNVAFHKMEGKGFFTKELQDALLDRHVDLVVHSLKDLPTEEPEGLAVVAIPERENTADLLLALPGVLSACRADHLELPPNTTVGTSSLRRAAQLLAVAPAVRIQALRGNVPTRIRKLRDGGYDAILLAAAGVGRLGLDLAGLEPLELDPAVMLPAPGQGALAIEARAGGDTARRLAVLHDSAIARCVETERRLLALLGGGCHLPLGCAAWENSRGELELEAALGTVDEDVTVATVVRARAVGPDPSAVAESCRAALAPGAEHG